MTSPNLAIETAALTKWFGSKHAVDSLSLQVPRGSLYAFLGRNGSGKTTTIRMLLGLVRPTSGTATVLGHDSRRLTPALRGRIGYMAESHPLHEWMTVAQEEYFASSFHEHWNAALFASIIGHFGLSRSAKGDYLSPGERAGLSLALTLAAEPEVVILDDPGSGLDPVAQHVLFDIVRSFADGGDHTVLFTSHSLVDVERTADHVAILDYSRLRVAGSLDDISRSVRQYLLTFPIGNQPDAIPAVPGLLSSTKIADGFMIMMEAGATPPRLDSVRVDEAEPTFELAALALLRPQGEDMATAHARQPITGGVA